MRKRKKEEEETLDKRLRDRYNNHVLKYMISFVIKEQFDMKNYVEPKLDVELIENDIITNSFALPVLGGESDDLLG